MAAALREVQRQQQQLQHPRIQYVIVEVPKAPSAFVCCPCCQLHWQQYTNHLDEKISLDDAGFDGGARALPELLCPLGETLEGRHPASPLDDSSSSSGGSGSSDWINPKKYKHRCKPLGSSSYELSNHFAALGGEDDDDDEDEAPPSSKLAASPTPPVEAHPFNKLVAEPTPSVADSVAVTCESPNDTSLGRPDKLPHKQRKKQNYRKICRELSSSLAVVASAAAEGSEISDKSLNHTLESEHCDKLKHVQLSGHQQQHRMPPVKPAVTCKRGHALRHMMADSEFICDRCACEVLVNQSVSYCAGCDYSLCCECC